MVKTFEPKRDGVILRHKKIAMFAVILVIFLVALTMFEMTLKYLIGLGNPVLYYSYPLYGYRLKPDQEVHRFHGSLIKVNNLGLRADSNWNDNIENKILFLGDSVTYGGSYISNDELFSTLAVKNFEGYMSGNAGINGWGVENIYGLIVEDQFLPSRIYVTVVIENDFYRGLTRLDGQPYWSRKPKFAFEELLQFFYFTQGIKKYINWEVTADEDEKKRVVDLAAYKLHAMDQLLKAKGFKHLIYISPTREQVLDHGKKDVYVEEFMKDHRIDAIYILDRINSAGLKDKEDIYYDYVHLSKYGHRVWADIIQADISKIINK